MLVLLGTLVVMGGYMWVCVIAFKESSSQGLLSLFVPFYSLYYISRQWSATRIPFFVILGGIGIYLVSTNLPVEAADFTLKDLDGEKLV